MKPNIYCTVFMVNNVLILILVWSAVGRRTAVAPPPAIPTLAPDAILFEQRDATTRPPPLLEQQRPVAALTTTPPLPLTFSARHSAPSAAFTHRHEIGARQCMVHNDGGRMGKSISAVGMLTQARLAYSATHARIARGTGVGDRTLLVRCVGGMGNCLNGVVTGLIVALLTGRAFFVDWKYPFQSCHINWDLAAASADLRATMASSAKTYAWVDDCFMPNEVTRRLERVTVHELDEMFAGQHVLLSTNCPLYKHLAANANLQPNLERLGLLRAQPLAIDLRNAPGAHTLTGANARFAPFTPGYLVYGAVMRTFGGLAPELFAEVVRMVDALPHGALLVGMQIRLGGAVRGVTDPVFLPDHMVDDLFRCARTLGDTLQTQYRHLTNAAQDAPLAFFLATDSERVIERAKGAFGARLVVSHGVPWHGVSGQGLAKTLIDQWMMVLSDALVVTPGSTFGATAAMINGRLPYYVTWNDKQCRVTDMGAPPPRFEHTAPAF